MDEKVLSAMFEHSQQQNPGKMQFSDEEASRFKKAFSDPKFRELFSEYMDEIQDPKYREETEQYISQLEGEQKIPEGKELIRPMAGFVAKTYKKGEGSAGRDKLFLNIVQSEKIAPPTKTTTNKGDCWSIPYSLGPPHMEKDKKGENATCFDCCFHPTALLYAERSTDYKNLLVSTAMEGVEEYYKRVNQKQQLERDFHIVKGISYKEGAIPTMMIATANKDNWNDKDNKVKPKDLTNKKEAAKSPAKPEVASGNKHKNDPPASHSDDEAKSKNNAAATAPATKTEEKPASTSPTKPKSSGGLAIKKGFLNNNKKSGLYEEKIPTIRPKNQPESLPPLPPSDADKKKPSEEEELINKMTSSLNLDSSSSAHSSSGNDKDAPVNVASEMKAVSTKRKIVEKAVVPEAVVPPPAPSVTEEKAAAQTSTPEETKKGPVEPVVVVKHREEFSLGDFQGMNKELAKSQRPTELVYEIQLPLAHSPSKISLDVSERRICLTYLDVYKLDMKLPYKVNDKKGKAAYDKNKKVLKVSLPVVSEEPLLTTSTTAGGSSSVSPLSSPVKPPVSTGKIVEEIQSKDNDVQDEGSSSSPSKTAAGKTKTGAASHNRWVEKKDTVTTTAANDQAAEESRKLYEDIKKQAEIARANALAQAANPPAPKTIPPVRSPPPKSTTVSFSSSSQSTPVTPTEAFVASKTFAGAKSGYIFQNGNQGVGYYVDPSIVLANAAKEKEQEKQEKKVELSEKSIDQLSTKKISDLQEELTSNTTVPSSQSQQIQYQLPSVEIKQTKEAVSILFQVSEINSSSVKIQFTSNYLFEVRFTRGKDGEEHYGIAFELDEKVCQQGVNPSSVQFDVASKNMVVVLLKNAPQIYQNNTSNKVEIIKISSETAKNSQQSWLQYKEILSSTTTITDPVPSSNDKGEEKKEAAVVPSEATKGKKSAKGKESATSKSLATEVFKSTVSNFQFNTDFISELD